MFASTMAHCPGAACTTSSPATRGHRWGDQLDIGTRYLVFDVFTPHSTAVGICSTQDRACKTANRAAENIRIVQFQLLEQILLDHGVCVKKETNRPTHLHVTFRNPPLVQCSEIEVVD